MSIAESILRSPLDLLGGTYDVLAQRKTRRFWYFPFILGIFSSLVAGALLITYRSDYYALVQYITPWQATWLEWISVGIAWLIGLLLVGLCALMLTSLLSAFFVESIVDELLSRTGRVETLQQTSFFSALRRVAADEIFRMLVIFPLVLLAAVLSFIPPLSILCFLLAALLLGYEIFELPLGKLELNFGERVRYCKNHFTATLALGCLASLALLIPFIGPALFPFFYAAALRAILRDKP